MRPKLNMETTRTQYSRQGGKNGRRSLNMETFNRFHCLACTICDSRVPKHMTLSPVPRVTTDGMRRFSKLGHTCGKAGSIDGGTGIADSDRQSSRGKGMVVHGGQPLEGTCTCTYACAAPKKERIKKVEKRRPAQGEKISVWLEAVASARIPPLAKGRKIASCVGARCCCLGQVSSRFHAGPGGQAGHWILDAEGELGCFVFRLPVSTC